MAIKRTVLSLVRGKLSYGLIVLFFLVLSLGLVLPLAWRGKVVGLPGDPIGTIDDYSFVRQGIRGINPWIGAPEGTPIDPGQSQVLDRVYVRLLLSLFSDVSAYNTRVFLAYFLTFLAVYFAIRSFEVGQTAAVAGSLLFGLGPAHMIRMWQHVGLGEVVFLPLLIGLAARFGRRPNWQTAWLIGVVVGGQFLVSSPYFAIMMLTVGGSMLLLIWLAYWRSIGWREIKMLISAGVVALIVALPTLFYLFQAKTNSASVLFSARRDYSDLARYSGHWWQYVVPPTFHPWWGEWARRVLYTFNWRQDNAAEDTYYLGFSVLVVIGVYVYQVYRRSARQRQLVVSWLLGLALVSFVWSIAPVLHFGLFRMPSPSAVVFHFFPYIRATNRYGIVVLLVAAILFAMAIDYLVEQLPKHRRGVVLGLISLAIILEYLSGIPGGAVRVADYEEQPVVQALARLPSGIVIHYPFFSSTEPRQYDYVFMQRIEQHPMVNGGFGQVFEERRAALLEPDVVSTVQVLDQLRVHYVVLHDDIYREGVLPTNYSTYFRPMDRYPATEGLMAGTVPGPVPEARLIYQDPAARIYELWQ